MVSSIYVASAEGFTGKSSIALGVLEQFSRAVGSVGVFRPIVRAEAGEIDYVLDLLTSHDSVALSYDECAGVTYDEVHNDPIAAMDRIVQRFHEVAEQCDAVIVIGSDYTDVGNPTEFSYNARIAANLGSPVLMVVNGHERSAADLHTVIDMLRSELKANHATFFGVVANRATDPAVLADPSLIADASVPTYAVPEEPMLNFPTVRDLMAACDGTLVSGDEELLTREVTGLMVAAMTLPNVLDRMFEGASVITPGDRPETVLGMLTAHVSATIRRSPASCSTAASRSRRRSPSCSTASA